MEKILKKIAKIWRKIKTQPNEWFFWAFLLTFTLSIRKVVLYFPLQEKFNEYTGIYLYLSDILLFLTIFSWLISLCYHKKITLSRVNLWITSFIHTLSLFLPLLLVFLAIISVFWSENKTVAIFKSIKLLEGYLLYIYVYFKIARFRNNLNCSTWNNLDVDKQTQENVPRGTFLKPLLGIIIFSGLIQSIIGIWQFIIQHSIGLTFLKESLISPGLPGIAKIIVDNNLIIRAYGLMPHPNILGGFLLFSIIVTLLYKKLFYTGKFSIVPRGTILNDKMNAERSDETAMFHVEQFHNLRECLKKVRTMFLLAPPRLLVKQGEKNQNEGTTTFGISSGKCVSPKYKECFTKFNSSNCSTWNNLKQTWRNYAFNLVISIQVLALLLTFSKSALIGLFIALSYIYISVRKPTIVPRGTILNNKMNAERSDETAMFHVEQFETNLERFNKQRCSTWNNLKQTLSDSISKDVPRGTIFSFNQLAYKHALIIFSICIALVFLFLCTKPNINSLFTKSLEERSFYLNVSRGTIFDNPIFGVGNGQFVLNMKKYAISNFQIWQYQPVHNVFLLIWSELGVLGLIIFTFWIWKMFHVEHFKHSLKLVFHDLHEYLEKVRTDVPLGAPNLEIKGTGGKELQKSEYILHNNNYNLSIYLIQNYFKGIFLAFLFIMLFDHYLWDIWPGQVLLWLIIGILAGINRKMLK